jgi:hypothetical protein
MIYYKVAINLMSKKKVAINFLIKKGKKWLSLKNPWGQKSKSREEKSVGKTFFIP